MVKTKQSISKWRFEFISNIILMDENPNIVYSGTGCFDISKSCTFRDYYTLSNKIQTRLKQLKLSSTVKLTSLDNLLNSKWLHVQLTLIADSQLLYSVQDQLSTQPPERFLDQFPNVCLRTVPRSTAPTKILNVITVEREDS